MADHQEIYDIFVVGGGINGCGTARDAAGRGHSVFLAEQNDLASGTSSGSTKLIHGGLRYLEHYEFSLVRKALMEREVLWKIAPHIIHPLRFVLPHHKGLRPAWLLRVGLFLYDYIGGRKLLPATKAVNLTSGELGNSLKSDFKKGFEYSDCWVDDARLVVLNAMDAKKHGAEIRTKTKVVKTQQVGDIWHVDVEDLQTGKKETVQTRIVINATGPWVDRFLNETGKGSNVHNVRLVQGSHIIVDKVFDHDRAYIFQNEDGRIIFAIPYENKFTMLGTTDHDFLGDPSDASITDAEVDYICEAASSYFNKDIKQDMVKWKFSGVRPLFDDGASKAQEATRDYVLRVENEGERSALINIFGGKITTYRVLAEAVLEKIEAVLKLQKQTWTETKPLPGGDFPVDGLSVLQKKLQSEYSFLDASTAERLGRLYGTNSFKMLADAKSLESLGQHFGADLYQQEVDYLKSEEFAITAEDILYRRTKIGLLLNEDEKDNLANYLK